eukprot:TRINITY_DN12882_c0_g1_i3.p2 TRINITY_DN12882_c0_g1~~TRINITY_DN12882_c0_g1_i3.p2  ORF type:complete len:140 (+),score=37.27 TRINITY_DN12882_c0_g1_i3:62-481(+)
MDSNQSQNGFLGFFFFFSSRRRHTRCREVSWARRCVQETDPGLAMSRAIGDEIGKYFGVIAEPEISCRKVEKSDLFITVCSDGVWEFLKNDEVAKLIYSKGKAKVEKSAAILAERAFNTWLGKENNITDDITCIIYYLN